MLKHFPSVPTLLWICIISGCWILPNAYSASIKMIISFLFFSLFFNTVLYCLICGYWTILANWGNPAWSWWIISLMYCWFQFANMFWAFLCMCLLEILANNFLWFCVEYLAFILGWCWPHRMSVETFRLFIFWNSLKKIGVNPYMYICLVEFTSEAT